MARFLVVTIVLLFSSIPAFAKPKKDIYPVSCSVLWNAVKDTLGNSANYTIMALDDSEMKSSYTVVGATRVRVNSVLVNDDEAGCELQVHSGDSGFANDDTGAFKKRLNQSLAKLRAAAPAAPPKPSAAD